MNNHYPSEGKILTEVDQLVILILNNKIKSNQLDPLLTYLYPTMMYHYNHDIEYTETIKWFVAVGQLLKGEYYLWEVTWDQQSTDAFIYEIQKYLPEYRLNRKAFLLQEKRNTNTLKEYLTKLLKHYSCLLVVRVDLQYQVKYSNEISVSDFEMHMKALRERMSNQKSCFKALEGFAWSLEQGYKQTDKHNNKGSLHCHLLLLYDGKRKDNGYCVGRSVGEKWVYITDGQGSYFNCNDPNYYNPFKDQGILGIEMINRNKPKEVQNTLCSSSYLTTKKDKYEQRLKAWLPRMRTFGHGTYRNTKRRGLPPIAN